MPRTFPLGFRWGEVYGMRLDLARDDDVVGVYPAIARANGGSL